MKRLFALVLIMALVLPLLPAHSSVAQDAASSFALGDWILTQSQINVYVAPDSNSTVVARTPAGARTQLLDGPVEVNGIQWWYVSDNGAGWIMERIADIPLFIPYSPAKLDEIVEATSRQLETVPEDIDALTRRGMAYYNLHQYELAIADFDRAMSLQREVGWLFGQVGKIYLDIDQSDMAFVNFYSATDLDPGDIMAWLRMGIAANNIGIYDEALNAYNRVISLAPEWGLVYGNLGVVYDNLGDAAYRDELYAQALALDPHLSYLYGNRSVNFRERGRNDLALDAINEGLAANPYDADLYVRRGTFYIEVSRDFEQAFSDFNRALEIDPENQGAFRHRGILNMQNGFVYNALADLEMALVINPRDDVAHYNYGAALAYSGDNQGSVDHYTLAMEYGGRFDRAALLYRAQAYVGISNYHAAVMDLEFFLAPDQGSDDPYFKTVALVVRGGAYAHLGSYDQAREDYVEAFARNYNFVLNFGEWAGGYVVTTTQYDRIAEQMQWVAGRPNEPEHLLELAARQLDAGLWQDALDTFDDYGARGVDMPNGLQALMEELRFQLSK